ncbi:hypothetical protein [Rhodococcoides fascians]|uniref:hypothetical protein n=1 Tax=Rhodococcoides fascians TaxID=1828 RepID=UPI001D403454|nr:hypothetical protein [Rhodococcus fascians]CAH0190323.1 hypothetical protein SRABI91_01657 [Rhodococcus fascians]
MADAKNDSSVGGAIMGGVMGAVMFGGYAAFIGLFVATFAWMFMDANWMTVFLIMAIVGAVIGGLAMGADGWKEDTKPKGAGGYPAGYMPNLHKHGTQEYYLNEIMNQQAMQADDERRRRNND